MGVDNHMKDYSDSQLASGSDLVQPILGRRLDSRMASIRIVVCDGGSAVALAGLIEPMQFANQALGYEAYHWIVAGYPTSEIHMNIGLDLRCETPWNSDDLPENVVVIGGLNRPNIRGSQEYDELEKKLRVWSRHGARLINIDLAVPIFSSGLSSDPQVCVHWKNAHMVREMHPELDVADSLYSVSGNTVFSAGGCAVTDLILQDISITHGLNVAEDVSELMLRGQTRAGVARQKRFRTRSDGTEETGLVDVLRLMEENIEDPLSISQICEQSTVNSRRKLERLFKRALGTSPWAFYRGLRLDKARSLVENTSLSFDEIAAACGFSCRAHMSSCFRKHFGSVPTKFRRT